MRRRRYWWILDLRSPPPLSMSPALLVRFGQQFRTYGCTWLSEGDCWRYILMIASYIRLSRILMMCIGGVVAALLGILALCPAPREDFEENWDEMHLLMSRVSALLTLLFTRSLSRRKVLAKRFPMPYSINVSCVRTSRIYITARPGKGFQSGLLPVCVPSLGSDKYSEV